MSWVELFSKNFSTSCQVRISPLQGKTSGHVLKCNFVAFSDYKLFPFRLWWRGRYFVWFQLTRIAKLNTSWCSSEGSQESVKENC